jgi:hypothetical protein
LLKKPKETQFALAAIEAYRSIPLDTKTWIRGGQECWERVVRLALLLRGGAGSRLNEIESSILSAIDGATHNDGYLAFWLANLLDSNGLGRDKRTHVAQILEGLAREFEDIGDLHRTRDYFAGAAKWFGRTGDELKAAEMTAAQAEAWVKEAIARASSEHRAIWSRQLSMRTLFRPIARYLKNIELHTLLMSGLLSYTNISTTPVKNH